MKSFLKSNLRYNRNHLEIIAISAMDREALETKVRKINEEKNVICLVSSLPVQMEIRTYSLIDVLSLKAIKEIQDEIDLKSTIVSMDKVIKDVLVSIKEDGLNAKIYEVIRKMEDELRITLPIDMLPGVIIHIACMLDRLVSRSAVAPFEGTEEYIAMNQEVHRVVRKHLGCFAKPYGVALAEDEICFVMKFFEKEEIA